MKMRTVLTAVSLAAAISSVLQAAADLPKAETLLNHYVEATGGKANYEKRTTEYMSGAVEIPAAGVKGKVEMWGQSPNSRVEVMEIDGVGRIETGTDGTIAWENSAIMGPRLQSGEELRYHLRDAIFNEPIRWRENYKNAETTGVEKVEGADCYRVVMTPVEGKPETWYFDQKTGLVLRMLRTSITTMGEVNGEYLMKDYKDVGGILMPMMLIQKAAGQEIHVKFDTVTPNAKMPPDRFTPPAEVKQLMIPPAKKAA
jgi:zinc protease